MFRRLLLPNLRPWLLLRVPWCFSREQNPLCPGFQETERRYPYCENFPDAGRRLRSPRWYGPDKFRTLLYFCLPLLSSFYVCRSGLQCLTIVTGGRFAGLLTAYLYFIRD